MIRRRWAGVLILIAIAAAIPLVRWKVNAGREEVTFQEQIRLARAEGLPTTAEEYKRHVPAARPEENAAPLYKGLRGKLKGTASLRQLVHRVTYAPDPNSLAEARRFLSGFNGQLAEIERATALPRCWFDRDWSDGFAVPFPEYADMKTAAQLLTLRGSVAAAEGWSGAALEDFWRVIRIAKHEGEEPHVIARISSEAIYDIGLQRLAGWSCRYRDRPEYARAFREALRDFPKPNLKNEYMDRLYCLLALIELSESEEGRSKLGLTKEDEKGGSIAEKIFPIILSKSQARIEIVRAEREYRAALDLAPKEMGPRLADAHMDSLKALFAFPLAARVYGMLSVSGEDFIPQRGPYWEAKRLRYVAVARALEPRAVPAKIKTSDLLSPLDGKPLRYAFDGKRIEVEVTGYPSGNKRGVLKLPPDEPKSP